MSVVAGKTVRYVIEVAETSLLIERLTTIIRKEAPDSNEEVSLEFDEVSNWADTLRASPQQSELVCQTLANLDSCLLLPTKTS